MTTILSNKSKYAFRKEASGILIACWKQNLLLGSQIQAVFWFMMRHKHQINITNHHPDGDHVSPWKRHSGTNVVVFKGGLEKNSSILSWWSCRLSVCLSGSVWVWSRGFPTQPSRAAIKPGFQPSRVENSFHLGKWERTVCLVGRKTCLKRGPQGFEPSV